MSTMTETTIQVYMVFIKASPEKIWDAITKPEFTSRYFHGSKSSRASSPALRTRAGRRTDRSSSSTARFSSRTRRGA